MTVPIYHKIYEKIKGDILAKKYEKGDKIPSERDLMLKFSCSRTTIRQALTKLQNDGYIYKIQGKGNYVSSSLITQNLNNFYSFNNQILEIGKVPSSKLISHEVVKADEHLSSVFELELEAFLYKLIRLRLIDKKPAMLETTYIPVDRFNKFPFEKLNDIAMYKIFKDTYNVNFTSAKETFKPFKLENQKDCEYLNVPKNDVVMRIVRTTYEYSKVIEYTISHVRNNVFEYTVNLSL